MASPERTAQREIRIQVKRQELEQIQRELPAVFSYHLDRINVTGELRYKYHVPE